MQTRQTSFRTGIRIAHPMKGQIATGSNAGLVCNVCKVICLLFCSDRSGHLQWSAGGCWPVRSAVWRKCSEWCRRCRTVLVSPLLLMIIHCYIYNFPYIHSLILSDCFCFLYKHNAGWIINTFHLTSILSLLDLSFAPACCFITGGKVGRGIIALEVWLIQRAGTRPWKRPSMGVLHM